MLLTASEWVGIAFLLLMFTILSCGQFFWNKVWQRWRDCIDKKRNMTEIYDSWTIKVCVRRRRALWNYLWCHGHLICFGNKSCFLCMVQMRTALSNQWHYFNICDQKSLSILLHTIQEFTPRNHGNGWKPQKFHEILHLPEDIYMFGSLQNYDNSPTEHGLIDTAKHPADHAQKSNTNFVSQVSKHMLETVLIWKAKQSLSYSCVVDTVHNVVDDTFSKLPNSPSFHVVFHDKGVCILRWIGNFLWESVHLNSVLLTWIECSKKNKQLIFLK